ncbi:MAG TPA: hypothetical protein VEU73_16410 [Gemmatimonadales bacterium]|nr:hypothetical protein [Gemmatimonadales bacterium]
MRWVAATLCVLPTLASVTHAQERATFAFRGDAAGVWLRQETAPGVVQQLRGPALGAEGRVKYGPLTFGAGLIEGRLDAASGGTGGEAARDLVEGRAFVAARALPWLEVSVGPLLRAYVTDSATERWVVWQGRARVDAPILTARLTSFVELWRGLSSRVTFPPFLAGRVQGGEAGLVYKPPRGPLWWRLAYRVDDALLGGGPGGSETVEVVTLSVGIGR